MFCISLRKRPLWRTVGPILASAGSLRLKEAKLETHDIELGLDTTENKAQRRFYVLLLTPACLEVQTKHDTVARLERFTALTGGSDLVIALLLSEESSAVINGCQVDMMPLLKLQNLTLEHLPVYIPVLPLQNPEMLLPALQSYIKDLSHKYRKPISPAPADLIPYCTVTAPTRRLDQHSVNILSDLFPTIRNLCLGVQTDGGRRLLREYIDPPMVDDILAFWGNTSRDG